MLESITCQCSSLTFSLSLSHFPFHSTRVFSHPLVRRKAWRERRGEGICLPDICGHETRYGPILREEDGEAVDQAEDSEADNRHVSPPGLHDGVVGQIGVGDALGFARLVEAEVDDSAADPRNEPRCVGQIDEPLGGDEISHDHHDDDAACFATPLSFLLFTFSLGGREEGGGGGGACSH